MKKNLIQKLFIFIFSLFALLSYGQKLTIIQDLDPGADNGCDPYVPIVSFKNKVYFAGSDGSDFSYYLYLTDGKSMSKLVTTKIGDPELLTVSGNLLFFSGYESAVGTRAMYVTDGTVAGTKRLKTVDFITHTFAFGTNSLLFTSENPTTDNFTLWKTDGATTVNLGTFPFKDSYTFFSTYKNSVIISEQSTNSNQFAPIITDGTLAGTKTLKDFLTPVIKFEKIESVTSVKDKIFVEGGVKDLSNGLTYNKKYITDLTAAGTINIDLYDFRSAFEVNNTIFVSTRKEIGYYNAALKTVETIESDKYFFSKPIASSTKIFYHDSDNFVWSIDAATKTTKKISKFSAGSSNYDAILFANGDSLFYSLENANGVEWNAVNLKTGKDSLFANYNMSPNSFYDPSMAAIGGQLILPRFTDANGAELWVFNSIVAAPLAATINVASPIKCAGGFTPSQVTVQGGTPPYTYKWSDPNFIGDKPFLVAGKFSLTVTDSKGTTKISSITVTEPTKLVATSTSTPGALVSKNGTATVNVSGGTTPYTYKWNTTPVQTAKTATGLVSGNFVVTTTDANQCQLVTTVKVDPAVSTLDLEMKYSLKVYPNPTSNIINIDVKENQVLEAKLFDSVGKLVYQQTQNTSNLVINVNDYPSGVYQLQVIVNDEIGLLKVVIQH
jgi:hypothetical protein